MGENRQDQLFQSGGVAHGKDGDAGQPGLVLETPRLLQSTGGCRGGPHHPDGRPRQRMPWVPVGLLLRDPFELLGRMGQVQAPLLVLQGARDQVVPPAMGRAVFAAAREPKQLWVAEAAGHNDIMGPEAWAVLTAFIRRHGPGIAP